MELFDTTYFNIIRKTTKRLANLQTLCMVRSDDANVIIFYVRAWWSCQRLRIPVNGLIDKHTDAKPTIDGRTQFLYVCLDLQNLVDIKERRGRRFSVVFTRHSMENDWKLAVWQDGAANEAVDSVLCATRNEIAVVETVVGKAKDGVVRSVVPDEFHNAILVQSGWSEKMLRIKYHARETMS